MREVLCVVTFAVSVDGFEDLVYHLPLQAPLQLGACSFVDLLVSPMTNLQRLPPEQVMRKLQNL